MYRVLIVEDDLALALEMKKQIEAYGNEAENVTDFHGIVRTFESYRPDLVLMDVMLPYKDGYYWTSEIRKQSGVPIVFISSASDNMNVVMAINMGADDFIAKPVDAMVFNAKVQAILRRAYQLSENESKRAFHGAVLNMADNSVTYADKRVELTKNEFRILQTLVDNMGKIVSRDALMLKLWNDDCFVEENTLTVNVNRLRKKLTEIGLSDVVVTKPGIGYMIR